MKAESIKMPDPWTQRILDWTVSEGELWCFCMPLLEHSTASAWNNHFQPEKSLNAHVENAVKNVWIAAQISGTALLKITSELSNYYKRGMHLFVIFSIPLNWLQTSTRREGLSPIPQALMTSNTHHSLLYLI